MAWGPRSRPDLPGGQSASSQQPHVCLGVRGHWQRSGTIQTSHAATAPQSCAQARPAPAGPQKRGGGCASGEGAAGSATLQSLQERPRKAAIH